MQRRMLDKIHGEAATFWKEATDKETALRFKWLEVRERERVCVCVRVSEWSIDSHPHEFVNVLVCCLVRRHIRQSVQRASPRHKSG